MENKGESVPASASLLGITIIKALGLGYKYRASATNHLFSWLTRPPRRGKRQARFIPSLPSDRHYNFSLVSPERRRFIRLALIAEPGSCLGSNSYSSIDRLCRAGWEAGGKKREERMLCRSPSIHPHTKIHFARVFLSSLTHKNPHRKRV